MQISSWEFICGNVHANISCKSHHVNAMGRVEKNLRGKFDRLNFEAICNLCYAACMKSLCMHPPCGLTRANLDCVHAACTVSKVACAFLNHGCDLGSHLSPSSLLAHPHDQSTTQ
jgi:hypothetical protein